MTEACDISKEDWNIDAESYHFKMGFDGCGMVYGPPGVIFGYGLETQCARVMKRIDQITALKRRIIMNCVGLSRGAMAILLLTKSLMRNASTKDIEIAQLSMNIFLFDPVPGNLIISSHLDTKRRTLANQCADVSSSKHLKNVIALYAHEPLSAMVFHAPLFPLYPDTCNVLEDVVLGKHQWAILYPSTHKTQATYLRIRDFLLEHGTKLNQSHFDFDETSCLRAMDQELLKKRSTTRYVHTWKPRVIVRNQSGRYLNKYHEKLCKERGIEKIRIGDEPDYMLSIEEENISDHWKKMLTHLDKT